MAGITTNITQNTISADVVVPTIVTATVAVDSTIPDPEVTLNTAIAVQTFTTQTVDQPLQNIIATASIEDITTNVVQFDIIGDVITRNVTTQTTVPSIDTDLTIKPVVYTPVIPDITGSVTITPATTTLSISGLSTLIDDTPTNATAGKFFRALSNAFSSESLTKYVVKDIYNNVKTLDIFKYLFRFDRSSYTVTKSIYSIVFNKTPNINIINAQFSTILLQVNKYLTTASSIKDYTYTKIDFYRDYLSIANIKSIENKNIGKNINKTIGIFSVSNITFNKKLPDNFNIRDLSSISYLKNINSIINIININPKFITSKKILNSTHSTYAGEYYFYINKNLNINLITVFSNNSLTTTKPFYNNIFINDSFNRLVNYNNQHIDSISTVDSKSVQFKKSILDFTNKFLDPVKYSFIKRYTDIIFSSETLITRSNVFRNFTDTASAIEELNNQATLNGVKFVGFYKGIVDKLNVQLNTLSFNYLKLHRDILNIVNPVSITTNKNFTDILNIKDIKGFRFNYLKNIIENFTNSFIEVFEPVTVFKRTLLNTTQNFVDIYYIFNISKGIITTPKTNTILNFNIRAILNTNIAKNKDIFSSATRYTRQFLNKPNIIDIGKYVNIDKTSIERLITKQYNYKYLNINNTSIYKTFDITNILFSTKIYEQILANSDYFFDITKSLSIENIVNKQYVYLLFNKRLINSNARFNTNNINLIFNVVSSNKFFASETLTKRSNVFRNFTDIVRGIEQLSNQATLNGVKFVGFYKGIVDKLNVQLNILNFNYLKVHRDILNIVNPVSITTNKNFTDILNTKHINGFRFNYLKNIIQYATTFDILQSTVNFKRAILDTKYLNSTYYYFSTSKNIITASKKINTIFNIYTRKTFSDITKSTDNIYNYVQYTRSFLDNTNYTYERKTFRYFKNIPEYISILDTKKVFNVLKRINNNFITNSYSIKNINKIFLDTYALNSIKYLNVNKYINNLNLYTKDSFNRVVRYYIKVTDIIDITDDYYGAATLGDDEYVTFGKITTDKITNQQVVYKYFNSNSRIDTLIARSINNVLTYKVTNSLTKRIFDYSALITNKNSIENILTAEYITNSINKTLIDISRYYTILKLYLNKYLQNEYFNIYDLTSISSLTNINSITNNTIDIVPKFIVGKNKLETSTIYTQNYYFNTNINLNAQLLTTSDSDIGFDTVKHFYNSITSNDYFSKTVDYNNLFIDIKTTVDSKIVQFKKSILDFTNKFLDPVKYSFIKRYTDIIFSSEVLITRSNILRNFTDIVRGIEQLSNQANINGSVFSGFYKSIVDKLNVQLNTLSFNYLKVHRDILNIVNPVSIRFSTTFSNILNLNNKDVFKFNYLKNVQQDTNTIYDLFKSIATFNIFVTDITQKSDDTYYIFDIFKDIYNIAQINTIPSIYYRRVINTDSLRITDIFSSATRYTKQFLDILGIADIGNKIKFNKNRIDYLTTQDNKYVYFNTQLISSNSFNTARIHLTFSTIFSDNNTEITETLNIRSNIFRNFIETIKVLEDLSNLAFIKGVLFASINKNAIDNLNVQLNTIKFNYYKSQKDILNTLSTITKRIEYGISDITSTVESGNINSQNYFAETYIESGYIGRIQYINMPSYWIDYVTASNFKNIDLLVLSNTKQFNNIIRKVESGNINSQNYFAEIYIEPGYIGRVQYFNTPSYWTEYVIANDFKNIDLLALNNTKQFSDLVTKIDVNSLKHTKQFNNILNFTDSLTSSLTYRSKFNNILNFTDSLTRISTYRRQFNDILKFTDSLTSISTYRRQFNDLVTKIDVNSLKYTKLLNNILNFTDSLTSSLTYRRQFNNILNFTDSLTRISTYRRQFNNIISFTDSLTSSSTYRREFNNIISFTDILITDISESIQYNISDIISTVESGNINSQNYFSEIYIESGYIGRIQYFNMPSYWIDYVTASNFKNIDLLALSNTKQFNNIIRKVESGNINSQNYFAEIYIESGYIGRVQYFDMPSYWIDYEISSDIINFTDSLTRSLIYRSQFNDIINFIDNLTSSLIYRSQFNDIINFTDTLITDIAAKSLQYNINNIISTVESGTINTQNYFAETYMESGYIGRIQYINILSNWVDYLIASNFKNIDLLVLSNTKRFNNIIINIDTTNINTTKNFKDTTTKADTTKLNCNKRASTDLIIKLDSSKLNYTKQTIDSIATIDVNSLKHTKQLNDIIISIEAAIITKNIVRNLTTDKATTLESGTINIQDYFGENYLDPGYIGSNTYIFSKGTTRTTTDTTKLKDFGIINKQNYAISNYAVPGYAGINIVY